jgi:hypothetical protein
MYFHISRSSPQKIMFFSCFPCEGSLWSRLSSHLASLGDLSRTIASLARYADLRPGGAKVRDVSLHEEKSMRSLFFNQTTNSSQRQGHMHMHDITISCELSQARTSRWMIHAEDQSLQTRNGTRHAGSGCPFLRKIAFFFKPDTNGAY